MGLVAYVERWSYLCTQSGFTLDTSILDNNTKYGDACLLISYLQSKCELVYLLSLLSAISAFHECAHLHPLQLQQYQYYSAGLLSTHDPYYEQQRHLLGPKKKKFKEEKKLKGKVTNLVFFKWLLWFKLLSCIICFE